MAFSTPSYGQGGSYTAASDRGLARANAVTPGVRRLIPVSGGNMQGDLAVTSTGTGNASVSMAAGDVWVDDGTGTGAYYSYNSGAVTVGPFAANSSGTTRTDLVYVIVTDTGAGTPTIAAAIATGSVTVPAKAVGIATVAIPNGFTGTSTVLAANITDVRPKAQLWDLSATSTSSVASAKSGNLIFDTSTSPQGALKVYNNAGVWTQLATTTGLGFTNSDMASGYTLLYQNTAAPPSPVDGQLWFDTTNKRLLIYRSSDATWQRISQSATTGRTGCTVSRAANQTLPFQTLTNISFDTESVDTDGFITVPSTSITIPAGLGGLYMIAGWVQGQNSLGTSGATTIYTTGSANQIATASAPALSGGIPSFGGKDTLGVSLMVPLAAGDIVRMSAYQSVASPSINVQAYLTCYRMAV